MESMKLNDPSMLIVMAVADLSMISLDVSHTALERASKSKRNGHERMHIST
jgi:hypothetical protein